jgi:hypothetical protein
MPFSMRVVGDVHRKPNVFGLVMTRNIRKTHARDRHSPESDRMREAVQDRRCLSRSGSIALVASVKHRPERLGKLG